MLLSHFFGDAVAQSYLHQSAGVLTFVVALLGVIAFDAVAADRLRQAVADRPDATLQELREAVGATCGTSAVHRALGRLGLRRKKSPSGPPSRTTPT